METAEHLLSRRRLFGIGERVENFEFDLYGRCRHPGGHLVFGGDDRYRLTPIADHLPGEYWLVWLFEAEVRPSGDIFGREDGMNSTDSQRWSSVYRHDTSVRMWASRGRPPEHALHFHVLGVGELTFEFGNAVGPDRRFTDPVDDLRDSSLRGSGHPPPFARLSNALMIAP